jgi:Zn-dependent protease
MSADRPSWEQSTRPQPAVSSFDLACSAPLDGAALDRITAQAAQILTHPPAERSWTQGLFLLVITLVIFAAAGLIHWTPIDLAILVGVLLLHESGHFLGMKLFNYQDVKMFFIPFFGAAVSGRSTSVDGYKEAIVLLLGPLPGIALGLVLGFVAMFYDNAVLRSAAMMLIWINGFNLLPLMPLDGGRVMHLIIFSRQRHIEAAFRVLTAGLLGLCALAGFWGLGIFAVLLLIGTPSAFQISKLAQQLSRAFTPDAATNPSAPLSHELAVALIERVRAAFPQVPQPANLANLARQVWERIHLRPPGLIASVLLLAVFGATFVLTPALLFVFHVPLSRIVIGRAADGSLVRVEEVRVWGQLQSTTELNAADQPDGRFVEYFPQGGPIKTEGRFVRGERDGVWTHYLADGQIESQQEYKAGQPIER